MHYSRFFFTVLLSVFFSCSATAQSGWTRSQGSWYAQMEAGYFSSNEYYSTEGVRNVGNTFYSYALKAYAEYGLTDHLTASLNWPLLKMQRFSGTESAIGMGDLQLGVKYALSKRLPIAIGLAVDIPTDDGRLFAEAKEENELGIRERINLPASDGEINVRSYLAVSQSFNGGKTYASAFGSFNYRTQGYSHQWQSGIELGQLLFQRLWVIGKLNQQGRFSEEVNRGVSFLYGEGTTYSAYNLSVLYKINDHWLITTSYQNFTDFLIPKRNLYDGGTFSIGMALEY